MKRYPLFLILTLSIITVTIPGLILCIRDKGFSYPPAAVMIQEIKHGNLVSLPGLKGSASDDPDAMAAAALKEAENLRKNNPEAGTGEEASQESAMKEHKAEEKKEEASAEKDTEEEKTEEEKTEEAEDEEASEEEEEESDEGDNGEFVTVDDDYFEDACFVGDSRIQGLGLYSGLPATNYGVVSMTLVGVFSKKAIQTDAGKVTIPEALALGPQFGKIYMKFGLNELGWGTDEQFADYYYSFIDYTKSVQPDAIIYVMGILHVTAAEERKSSTFTNEKINHRNEVIKEVAENEHVIYLDVNEVFTDEEGCMPEGDTFDGIHVKADAIGKWADYLKTHAVEEE